MPGTTEIKELLSFAFKLAKAVDETVEDGKVSILLDAPKFLPALMAAPKAFAGIANVLLELEDLDAEEQAELMAWVKKEFDLRDNRLEASIEEAVNLALHVYRFARVFKNAKA
jgi:hypothetical protein